MAVSISMPQFGQSVVEGTVASWLKAEGDAVERDEALLTVSTDKIDTDVPAPISGVLLRICVAAGETVDAGTVLAYVGDADETWSEDAPPTATAPDSPPPEPDVRRQPAEPTSSADAMRGFLSPVVARMIREHDLDPSRIQGSGRGGRITRKDVQAVIDGATAAPSAVRQPAEGQTLRPLTSMRRAIAEHMSRSVRTSPHVTSVFEVDLAGVVRHRARHQAEWQAKGVPLTYTAYFLRAAVDALQAVPEVNASFTEEGLIQYGAVHLGVAVAVPDGLVVPVIRDAETMNMRGLARALAALTRRAQEKELGPDDMVGGTFTLTNHGVGGSLAGTPIIHQPQAAILGVGAIVKRPVVRGPATLEPHADDAIVIRPMCLLSLSFDHRALDGATADRFLTCVRDALQTWA